MNLTVNNKDNKDNKDNNDNNINCRVVNFYWGPITQISTYIRNWPWIYSIFTLNQNDRI